jgi:hypothetical protein
MVKTPGSSALIRLDPLDGLDAVASALLHAGRQGENERVEDEVRRLEPVAVDGDVVDGPGRTDLPVGRPGLALGVDAGAHDGGSVLPGQGEEPVEPGAGIVSLLQVDRVEDGPAADPPQGRLDHRCLGGVDHQWDAGLGGEPADDLVHVGDAVGAGVVDADVEDVGALL